MGNEGSKLKGLIIDTNAVEANDFWALYNAVASTTSNEEGKQYLSIFQGEPVVTGQLWLAQGPMERAIRNLMIYRHPYILKYVCTWEQGGQKHLATERVLPLSQKLKQQSDIQICLGLRTILCSLIFLVEKAMARHLNICIDSIYVTAEGGSWRLAGFEYVWKQKEVTKTLLDFASSYRYNHAIDPEESKDQNIEAIEQYAFATLCEEILAKQSENLKKTPTAPIPHVGEFIEYCGTHLKHKNTQMRPKLSAVLLHPYFNHEFVLIHAFLFELPLKNNNEKQEFFTGLIDRLRYFDEEIVGAQFAGDLLSRMVLLDTTAQLCVTPYVLRTKTDHTSALFSGPTYTQYLMPHILKMFRLRDAQIRLILLEYFMEFVRLLSKEDLEENILPHLAVGMQDTNDVLVAKTLRCMADLMPILGAATVLGGQRTRLFSDGRPQAAISDCAAHWVEPRSITPVLGENDDSPIMVSGSPILGNLLSKSNSFSSLSQAGNLETYEHSMPPRLSPDGGEDIKCPTLQDNSNEDSDKASNTSDLEIQKTTMENGEQNCNDNGNNEDDEDPWSDWENDEDETQRITETDIVGNSSSLLVTEEIANNLKNANNNAPSPLLNTLSSQQSLSDSYRTAQSTNSSSHSSLKPSAVLPVSDDLSCLDIQVQKISSNYPESSEFDFFKDMEPVIQTNKTTSQLAPPTTYKWLETEHITVDSSRFAAEAETGNDFGGWQVDDDDVGGLEEFVSTSSATTPSNV
ncbi:protein-associating with the carboxyl-terminal domain of ezrin [Stomoxys calcitrans]|uniref:Phosphatase 2A Regulatory Subunit A helical domain-containing protein n=1 Tax=Stomoxys calcitrans TaxID=35570 RepID=A0A1I8PMZ2_STOCA|nr:protein-associating with the carboxyl-terminal domain of ezrin [Stomoxys calcitrans]